MKKLRNILKWLSIAVACPIALFLLLSILLYIPPIQNFIVDKVAESLSESMKMDIKIREVKLSFPLDLAVYDMTAVEKGDTLLDAKGLKLSVALRPLFKGRADIDGISLYGVKLDSKSYISDTHIKGSAGELTAATHGVDWKKEFVNLDRVKLSDANLYIALSDTAKKDTTTTPVNWVIQVEKADIVRSCLHLSMPGDTMRIGADLQQVNLRKGKFDLGKGFYGFESLLMAKSGLTYDLPQYQPVQGLDVNHLAIHNLGLQIDTFSYNGQGEMRAGLRKLVLNEKCGLQINCLSGNVFMDTTRLYIPNLLLQTPYSKISADADFDFSAFTAGKGGACEALVEASIGTEDLRTLSAAYVDPAYLHGLPAQPSTLKAEVTGNMNHWVLKQLKAEVPGMAQLQMDGYADRITMPSRKGKFKLDLKTQNMAMANEMLPAELRTTLNIPNGISARGTVDFNGDHYGTNLDVHSGNGRFTAQGSFNSHTEAYQLKAESSAFPLAAFLKGIPLGPFSGSVSAEGQGFDFTSTHTRMLADANIHAFNYDKYDLGGLSFKARLQHGKGQMDFVSTNPMLTADGHLEATLQRNLYEVSLQLDAPEINMARLGVTKDTLIMGTYLDIQGKFNPSFTAYSANGTIARNHFSTSKMSTMARDIHFNFSTDRDTTTAHVSTGDLTMHLGAKGDVDHLSNRITAFIQELSKQLDNKVLDQEKLKSYFPTMAFYFNVGRDNFLYRLARMQGYSFSSGYINLNTNPLAGMTGEARIGSLEAGALQPDTIRMYILQDANGIQMNGLLSNNKRNKTPFELQLKSNLLPAGGSIELIYFDKNGKKGMNLGLQAELTHGGIKMHLFPKNPILAYRKFKVNKENFIFLGKDKLVRADLKLLADDGTGLHIYGEPRDSTNDLTVSVKDLNLDELSSVMPYLPKLGGMLTGDVHVTSNAYTKDFSAMADVNARNFKYEGVALGNIGVDAIYLPKTGGEHHISAFVNSDETEVMQFDGTYYDKNDGYLLGNAQLYEFPLGLLNGFMVGTDVALKGKAAGNLNIKGPVSSPVMNGQIDLDSAHVYSEVYGFDFRTDERAIDIKDSRLTFKDYNLYSTGKAPLVLNGIFDMSDFSAMRMDFDMRARNFELINTRKKAKSMVFGKVYANFDGTLRGSTDDLAIRGKIEVLDRTDMTYILKDSPLSVDNRLNDLVQFVSFEDTTTTEKSKPAPTGSFDLTLGIAINDAARFHCNLSDDGQSYVNLEGGGDLTLRMTQQGEMRMTGRFTANSGEMKYSLPVIPLKNFHLVQGSFVEFTGDVMNPTLNIAAKERTKAVVTENDKPRSVAFDVGVAITRPLNEMGLEFTIEAPEDLAVQNQLAAMSKEQRGKAAVTMMATGMYMTDETMMSGSGFKTNNALNAFLQSEIQNIAGSALKTIDINLGVESGTSETGTSTTDYSFQFAKRFWGNRVSVIIGGKVSTGADASNSAESFINNVSVEYRLDRSATRYVKVFYDRDSHDPLEGQITRTGAGLILRRKTDRLGELFIFKKKKTENTEQHAQ